MTSIHVEQCTYMYINNTYITMYMYYLIKFLEGSFCQNLLFYFNYKSLDNICNWLTLKIRNSTRTAEFNNIDKNMHASVIRYKDLIENRLTLKKNQIEFKEYEFNSLSHLSISDCLFFFIQHVYHVRIYPYYFQGRWCV